MDAPVASEAGPRAAQGFGSGRPSQEGLITASSYPAQHSVVLPLGQAGRHRRAWFPCPDACSQPRPRPDSRPASGSPLQVSGQQRPDPTRGGSRQAKHIRPALRLHVRPSPFSSLGAVMMAGTWARKRVPEACCMAFSSAHKGQARPAVSERGLAGRFGPIRGSPGRGGCGCPTCPIRCRFRSASHPRPACSDLKRESPPERPDPQACSHSSRDRLAIPRGRSRAAPPSG